MIGPRCTKAALTHNPLHPAQAARALRSISQRPAAWDRRRRDLQDLGGIIDVLIEVERRADELNHRAAELVEGWL